MILRNKTDDPRWLPDLALNVGPGETFEATGDLAAAYLAQNWCVRVDTPARQRAARERRGQTQPERALDAAASTDPAPDAADTQE